MLTWDCVVGDDCAAASTFAAMGRGVAATAWRGVVPVASRRRRGVVSREGSASGLHTLGMAGRETLSRLWTGLCGVLLNAVGLPLGLHLTLQIDS